MGSTGSQGRNRRIDVDVMKLLTSDFKVDLIDDNMQEFTVEFHGPDGTPYEGGVWLVRVSLPSQYPYKSPSIGFTNRMFHPNVEESRGAVCLDVINETWSPIYGLLNIFESFLPQLLAYPNAADPLNHRAAALWKQSQRENSSEYSDTVRKYVQKYAAGSSDALSAASDAPVSGLHGAEKKVSYVAEPVKEAKDAGDEDLSDLSSLDEPSDDEDF